MITKSDFFGYKELSPKIKKQFIYPSANIDTPFGNKHVLYADYIASGKPSPTIEQYIIQHIYSKYSNTHSNASNGICMKQEIEKVRQIIKKEYNINDTYEVLFKGSGTTGAINHLINCLSYCNYSQVHIFISSYEHYSNHLTWLKLAKENPQFAVHIIPLNNNYELNTDWYNEQLNIIYGTFKPKSRSKHNKTKSQTKSQTKSKRKSQTKHDKIKYLPILIITSIIHCSNLTGYFLPLKQIKQIMDKHKSPNITKYLFADLACSAPYRNIDASMFDAVVFSGHKFIGGVETPGVLIAKTCLFQKSYPIEPGGSCIKQTHYNEVEYSGDIEVRESAGTPNIIGIIKLGQCLLLKHKYQSLITTNENILLHIMRQKIDYFKNKYPFFFCVRYSDNMEQLPILSFSVQNLHYNHIVVLLNDIFGIQTRGGRSCSGLFTDIIKDQHHINGFCRVSFHYSMSIKEVLYIFNAIEYIIQNGQKYVSLYKYNKNENLFTCIDNKLTNILLRKV